MALVLSDCSLKYKEFDKLKKEDVKYLLKWCQMQQHLPKLTEMQTINFLHANDFSTEAAKRCIDNFFTVRTHCPEFFAKRNPKKLNLKCVMNVPFEKKAPDGNRILFGRLMDHNPNSWHLSEHIKLFDMATMLVLNREGPANGVIIINDMTGFSFTHVAKINLLQVKKVCFYVQECMPMKVKAVHYVNAGNVLDKVMALAKPFMKKELADVIHIHPTMDTIYKVIPNQMFPKDYPGGCAPSIKEQHEKFSHCLLENCAYFLAEEEQLVNEGLRAGKPKNSVDIFGIEGTFKKLDID